MTEYICFGIGAALICVGIAFTALGIFGVYKFDFALNRMHSSALGDTLGLLFIMAGLIVFKGFCLDSLKLAAVVIFMWLTSPISSHLLAKLEFITDEKLSEHCDISDTEDK